MVELKARPQQSLRRHQDAVASGTLAILQDVQPHYEGLVSVLGHEGAQRRLEQLIQIISYCHDFGKASPLFQRKVGGETLSIEEVPLSYHTHIGALLGFLAVRRSLSDISDEMRCRLAGMAMAVILLHHSPYSINPFSSKDSSISLVEMLREEIDNTFRIILLIRESNETDSELMKAIFPQEYSDILESVTELLELDVDELQCLVDAVEDALEVFQMNTALDDYMLYRVLYSTLCDMDEYDAGFSIGDTGEYSIERDLPRNVIPSNVIDHFRESQIQKEIWQPPTNNREKRIRSLREDTYRLTIGALNSDARITSLQAPTGSGKTLAMLSYAVRLRAKINKEKGVAPRIIYALPFISIAEQVEDVVRDVFNIKHTENDALLTVHHSLGELKWYSQGDEYNPKDIRFFIDRWRSDIIITTTVRLCETILGPSKRESIRFNRLAGSIILMDEVQSFPVKYWDIIGETIKALVNDLGCHVLLATATMPAILRPEEVYSIRVGGYGVGRYALQYESRRISLSEFTQEVLAELQSNSSSNTLVVLNTKAAAASVYSEIQKHTGPGDSLYFLSGWVAPIHRRQTISNLRTSLELGNSRVILVCTQVIEAGVDVSFDITFRDLAPVDSILQVAGRCNRSWENEHPGIVKVRCVFDPESKQGYAQSVYDEIDLEMTKEVLQERDGASYDEEALRERLDSYFSEIRKRKATNIALGHAQKLEWDDLGRTFNLIDTRDTSCKVLIQCDGCSQSILDEIRDRLREKRVWIPAVFYRYCIELSKNQYDALGSGVESVCDSNGHLLFGVIRTEHGSGLYSSDTGLKAS